MNLKFHKKLCLTCGTNNYRCFSLRNTKKLCKVVLRAPTAMMDNMDASFPIRLYSRDRKMW